MSKHFESQLKFLEKELLIERAKNTQLIGKNKDLEDEIAVKSKQLHSLRMQLCKMTMIFVIALFGGIIVGQILTLI